MVTISASVGQGGYNRKKDVLSIQKALNQIPHSKGGPIHKLKEDGLIGPKTLGAIIKFQKTNIGLAHDGRIDVKRDTLARINGLLGPAPKFTDKNLYGHGGPAANDIRQDVLGDCYFVATLGAVAQQKPSIIRNAIVFYGHFQEFRVRLYDTEGKVNLIWVNQKELQYNVMRQGGSYVDNTGNYKCIWPAVMETAHAKMFDTIHLDGLKQGFDKIGDGGFQDDAMMAITGDPGTTLYYVHYPKLGKSSCVHLLGARVSTALKIHQSVTLSTDPEKDSRSFWKWLTRAPIPQDGLVDSHLYTVVSIVPAGKDWKVTVRNPWGTNLGVSEGKDTPSATMSFSLDRLVTVGGLNSFQVSK